MRLLDLAYWRLTDPSIRRKFIAAGGALLVLGLLCAVVGYLLLTSLSAARAFTVGESLWTKQERIATSSLIRYLEHGDPGDRERAKVSLDTLVHVKRARLELDSGAPHHDEVFAAFRSLGMTDSDTNEAVSAFVRYRHVAPLARAIDRWSEADLMVAELCDILTRETPPTSNEDVRSRVEYLTTELGLRERAFTSSIADAAALAERAFMLLMGALATAIIVVVYLFLAGLFRSLTDATTEMIEGARKIGAGDLDARVSVNALDELGQLGQAINKMADDLREARAAQRGAELLSRERAEHAEFTLAQALDDQRAREAAERAQVRAEFVADAGALLFASLDADVIIEKLGRYLVSRLADIVVVRTVPSAEGSLPGRLFVCHADDSVAEDVRAALASEDPAEAVDAAIRYRLSMQLDELDEATLREVAPGPRVADVAVALGVSAVMVIPLIAHEQCFGTMTLLATGPSRRFSQHELAVGEAIAREAGLALANARFYALAQSLLAARNEFLSIASHELKTPITPLRLQIESMLRRIDKPSTPGKLRDQLEVALRQVKRLANLVNQLMEVSRISANKLDLRYEKIDVGRLLSQVVDGFSELATTTGTEVVCHVDDLVLAEVDPARIEQIVVNMVSNALKYGSGKPIVIRLEQDEKDALISVRDHGIGISEADWERVFERFERTREARQFGGLGLGLYISRQVALAHHGDISVQSVLGEGSTFTLRVPKTCRDSARMACERRSIA